MAERISYGPNRVPCAKLTLIGHPSGRNGLDPDLGQEIVARVQAQLLNPAGARPTLHAGARVELRGLLVRERALAPAQDEPVVRNRRRAVAERVALRHGKSVVAAGG